jgi:hypothetical protein
MKKSFVIFLFLAAAITLKSQSEEGFQKHDGFYLSMAIGPVFGSITDVMDNQYDLEFSGTGAVFDFKIGGAIKENFILHATIISNSMPGPSVKNGSQSAQASDNISINEVMFGGGFTYYIMPQNFFVSGSIGAGNFSISDSRNSSNTVSTQKGLSLQLKVGKEWWVSKNWGLGIGITYGKTNLTNSAGSGLSEKMDSNRFGILFNTTFN